MTSKWLRFWRELVIGLLVLALGLLSVSSCPYVKKGVSEENQVTIDSLKITQPSFDSSKLASRKAEAAHVATGEVHRATVVRSTSGANRERVAADSLARLALAVVDEVKGWRDAYEARTRETDSLRVALAAANAQAASERLARFEADRRAALDSARHAALQKLALGLEVDANKAANCRIARVIPCATRTQVFVTGAILGAVGAYAAKGK